MLKPSEENSSDSLRDRKMEKKGECSSTLEQGVKKLVLLSRSTDNGSRLQFSRCGKPYKTIRRSRLPKLPS